MTSKSLLLKENIENQNNKYWYVLESLISAVKNPTQKIEPERVIYALEIIANAFREVGILSENHTHFTTYQGSARRYIEEAKVFTGKLKKSASLNPEAKVDVETALTKAPLNKQAPLSIIVDLVNAQLNDPNSNINNPERLAETILRGFAETLTNPYLDWARSLDHTEREQALDYFNQKFTSVTKNLILALDVSEAGVGLVGLDIPVSVINLLASLSQSLKAPNKAKWHIVSTHTKDALLSQGLEALIGYTTGGAGLLPSAILDGFYQSNRKSLNILLQVFQALINVESMHGGDTTLYRTTLKECKDSVSQKASTNMLEMMQTYIGYKANQILDALEGPSEKKKLPPAE